MYSKETFESMTVVELRKLARENGVTLSAGISKQGIVERLCDALIQTSAAPSAVSDPRIDAVPTQRRAAAIVTDDEDTPVLTPNAPFTRTLPTSVPRPGASVAPAPRPASSTSAPAVNRGNVPGTNKPVFSLEGVRAWHNPRNYPQQSAPGASSYGQRPVGGMTAQRPSMPQASPYGQQRPVQRPFQTVSRFGPDAGSAPQQETPQQEHVPYPAASQRPTYGTPYHASATEAPALQQSAPYQGNTTSYGSELRPRRESYPLQRDLPAPQESAPSPNLPELLAMGDITDSTGVLEIHPEGYGFLRTGNFLPGSQDVYVSNAQIRRFQLKNGDLITGKTRPQRENDRYCAMLYITEINGVISEDIGNRVAFEKLTALQPNRQIVLAQEKSADPALRIIDLAAPIGFGQRALIVAPPRSGKTQLLRHMAASISAHYPDVKLISLLLGERPEDMTTARKELPGQVVYATFDEPLENQLRVSELALEHALRLVEQKKDVVLFVDNLTSLCRAYSDSAPQNVRMLQGGLAAGAVAKPKRLFGAARNVEEGGSLTVIAVMTADTLSPLDVAIADEFHGAANMELRLVRHSGNALTPMIDLTQSTTRHPQLLQNADQLLLNEKLHDLARHNGNAQTISRLLKLLEKTQSAKTLLNQLSSEDEA